MSRKSDLYARATALEIKGRSKMTVAELEAAVTAETERRADQDAMDAVRFASLTQEERANDDGSWLSSTPESAAEIEPKTRTADRGTLLPNRADRRAMKRARALRNDGRKRNSSWGK